MNTRLGFIASVAMFSMPALALADAAAAPATTLTATAPDAMCAAVADATRVAALYAAAPAPMTFQAAPQLKLSEASIASAIPVDKAMGTSGANFVSVWDSMTHWHGALFLIMKGGNVFEISSTVSPGVPSTKSKFFNLGHDAPVSGHLRPDLVSAIYAMQLPTREGFSRAVMFYDAKGDSVFGVVAGGEGKELNTEQMAQFKATWDLIAGLPRACATTSSSPVK